MGSVRKITKQICIAVIFTIVAVSLHSPSIIAASEHKYKSKYIGQERAVVALYNDMHTEAIALGHKLIEYEEELNNRFAERNIDEKVLDQLLTNISETYKLLRYTHLSAHLQTPGILTEAQIKKYNKLRGYSSDDPCANIPKGHDPVMWRKHNNCD